MRVLLSLPPTDPRRAPFDPSQPAVAVDYVTRPHTYCSERIRRELGFEPRVSIDEGFARIAAALRE